MESLLKELDSCLAVIQDSTFKDFIGNQQQEKSTTKKQNEKKSKNNNNESNNNNKKDLNSTLKTLTRMLYKWGLSKQNQERERKEKF